MTDFKIGDRVRFKADTDLINYSNQLRRTQNKVGTIKRTTEQEGPGAVRVLWDGEDRTQLTWAPKLELVEPESVRATTLKNLKRDREAALTRIGTNQTTVDELNDKIERDTATVQELDDLIRDIEKPKLKPRFTE